MKRFIALAFLCTLPAALFARHPFVGVDAFNRTVPASSVREVVFSPLAFELDAVVFAEAVDPIRRSRFTEVLGVTDEFSAVYRQYARMPLDSPGTNGVDLVWARALLVDEPRRIDSAYRYLLQDFYDVEVCRAKHVRGIEAWVKTRFEGAFDFWRSPSLASAGSFMLIDLVSAGARSVSTNAWKHQGPSYTAYRVPLVGGADFHAIVPKADRSLTVVRSRFTSQTIPVLLSAETSVIEPPERVRVSLPPMEIVSTNELAGAFSYLRLPTSALKPLPPGSVPSSLRQTVRCRLKSAPAEPGAETLEGPFLFFIHDRETGTLPVLGVYPGKEPEK